MMRAAARSAITPPRSTRGSDDRARPRSYCSPRRVVDSPNGCGTGGMLRPRSGVLYRLLTTNRQRVGDGMMGRVAATGEPMFLAQAATAEYARATTPEYREIIERLRVGS